jgi:hypothetical protein
MAISQLSKLSESNQPRAGESLDLNQAQNVVGDGFVKLRVQVSGIAGTSHAPVGMEISKIEPRESDLASLSLPP